MKTYLSGHKMNEFKWDKQDMLLNELLTSQKAEPMRQFMRDNLDGVWLDIDPIALKAMQYADYQRLDSLPKIERLPQP